MSQDIQADFAAALRDDGQTMPQGLAAWNGPRMERRFGVYRNNVVAGLVGALASRFPVTEKIVGQEFFAGMAMEFVRLHPPRSPLLLAYGEMLAEFAAAFEPAKQVFYLPDIIRLEIARGNAYHAADAAPLDPALLASLAPERVAELRFTPHPSLSVVRSDHPVVTIWAMNSGEMPLAPIEDWRGEDALVVRPQMIVDVHRLPKGGATFLEALADGGSLAAAVEAAMQESRDFDISANLAGALQAGAFTAIR